MSKFKKNLSKVLAVILSVTLFVCAIPVGAVDYTDVVPAMNNTYPYSVYEREDVFYGDMFVTGNTAIANGRLQFGYFNADGSVIDTTEADYLELDVWSDVQISNTLSLWLSSNVWEESGRALFSFPALNAGWNHVVINLSQVQSYANFGTVKYDRAAIKSLFLRGTPKTAESKEISIKFANAAFTTANAVAPAMSNTYPYSVFEKEGLVWRWDQSAGQAMNWSDYSYINSGNSIDITNAKYFEFDLSASVATSNFYIWLSTSSGDMAARKRYNAGGLKVGNNHVVIDLSKWINIYQTESSQWNTANIKSIFLEPFTPTVDYSYKFSNFAFTTDDNPNSGSPADVPDAVYQNSEIIATRDIDLAGSKNNTTDERYFDWNTYCTAFADMMSNPLNITEANYIEFDYYSDIDDSFSVTLGSLHTANGFQFYDNRSNGKQINVKAGWNHIVLSTDGAYREADTSTLGSYNPESVTGFILRGPSAGYVRLTNVALTGNSFVNDPVLNYRDDFKWGSVMHAPDWGLPYRPDNLELQIKQLRDMGGTLLRVDAVGNFSHIDKTVKLCNAYGIKVMLIVYIPGKTFDSTAKVDLEAIKTHFRTYATRYDGKHGCGKADYIQIDNEMDVAIMGWTGMGGNGINISEYPESSLKAITAQVKAASEGIASAGTDIKRIINIAWVHYGILKYFKQEGVEWDITGHDWYQDMFGYGGNADEYYASGQELYDLFGKPIIICETNMWMNSYNGNTDYPDYSQYSWWDPLVECLQDYYEKDFVIGCVIYEFYDEPTHQSGNAWTGEAHFGMMEVNTNGSFKTAKPIYYRCKHLFGGDEVDKLLWHTVEDEYSIWGKYDMRDLIAVKNAVLSDSDVYDADYDFVIDGYVDSSDITSLRRMLFESF